MRDRFYRFWSDIAAVVKAGSRNNRPPEIPPPSLRDLAADARTRVPDPPAWDDVLDEARRIRLAVLQVDAFVIAGLVSSEAWIASNDDWPADVKAALKRLGWARRYSPTTFNGCWRHLSPCGREHLANPVKGAWLELHTVDGMNHGDIPMTSGATHAELAHSLNQPGYDITEHAPDAHVVDHVQVKATDNWHLIERHLSRYPEYPHVETTHEGAQAIHDHAQAMLDHGLDPQQVHDTGIHADWLNDHIGSHIDHINAVHTFREIVPEIALAAIVAVAAIKLRRGESLQATLAWAKRQATLAGISRLAGLTVQLLTGTAAVRPLAAIGTRFTFERGYVAQQTAATLARIRATLEALRESCDATGYAPWSANPSTAS